MKEECVCTVRETMLWIQVPTELDHHNASQISREADERVQKEDVQEIVFDFAKTVFCDSSGIGMLMGRYKMMWALGGTVRAVHVGERVSKILTMSGITKIIPVELMQGGNME